MAKGWHSKTLPLSLFLASAVLSQTALAGDWSLLSFITEKGDFNDNYRLKPISRGAVFGSITDVNVDLIHKSAIDRFDLVGDLAYQRYFGPGEADVPQRFTPRLSGLYHLGGKTDTLDLQASYIVDDVSTFDPLDPTTLASNAVRQSRSASAAYSHALDLRNTVGTSLSLQDVTFSDGGTGGTPSFTIDLSTYWNYRLTKTTNFRTTAGFDSQSLKDFQNTTNLSYWVRGDLSSTVLKNLQLNVGGGPRLGVTSLDNIFFPSEPRISNTTLGWIADASLIYTFKSGTLSASASHSVDPSAFGDLQTRTSFSVSAAKRLNEESQVALTAQYRISSSAASADQTIFLISPTYNYQLDRQWSMSAGYRWTSTQSNLGSGSSNDVFLSVTKAFVLNP